MAGKYHHVTNFDQMMQFNIADKILRNQVAVQVLSFKKLYSYDQFSSIVSFRDSLPIRQIN